MRFPYRAVLLVAGLVLVGAACASNSGGVSSTAPPTTAEPTTAPTTLPADTSVPPDEPADELPLELAAACGPVPFEWPNIDVDAFEPFEGDISEFVDDEARLEFEASFGADASIRWSVVEETGTALLLFARPETVAVGEPQYGYAEFAEVDGAWRARGWGGCRIEVTAPGYGVATFVLDPEYPPDSSAQVLHVLATERECASGQAPVGREALSIAVETSDRIEITILVEAPTGDQACPSNPAFPLMVELNEPLGDRQIWDAALRPMEQRTLP